jgi:hypothetical protein
MGGCGAAKICHRNAELPRMDELNKSRELRPNGDQKEMKKPANDYDSVRSRPER